MLLHKYGFPQFSSTSFLASRIDIHFFLDQITSLAKHQPFSVSQDYVKLPQCTVPQGGLKKQLHYFLIYVSSRQAFHHL